MAEDPKIQTRLSGPTRHPALSGLVIQTFLSDPATYNALMELGSAALGGIAGGQVGAKTALAGDQFNRQLHPDEFRWIRQNAEAFALQEGIREGLNNEA
ncbi:hypothetical protein LYZ87_22615 [Xanthomonas hortorum pv. vitians]|nr:hypothetical protein [Xanthomonas hortorum]MCE4518187.1 hypothetical protein [Xanthomonas hortorum pv. vitians]